MTTLLVCTQARWSTTLQQVGAVRWILCSIRGAMTPRYKRVVPAGARAAQADDAIRSDSSPSHAVRAVATLGLHPAPG